MNQTPDSPSLHALLAAVEAPVLRERVFDRVADSARRHAGLHTVRARHARWTHAAPGVRLHALVEADDTVAATALRAGQPCGAWIVELAPGAVWRPGIDPAQQREWLVMAGDVRFEAVGAATPDLAPLDFHVDPAGHPARELRSRGGARLYVRFAPPRAGATAPIAAATVRDATAPWDDFAPGIRRRTLWSDGIEAAYLVRAQAGAQVPAHGHRIDEECLMLDGDLYLGDVLLRGGDWQLAPVGAPHGLHVADSALTLWVRGDVELRFEDA